MITCSKDFTMRVKPDVWQFMDYYVPTEESAWVPAGAGGTGFITAVNGSGSFVAHASGNNGVPANGGDCYIRGRFTFNNLGAALSANLRVVTTGTSQVSENGQLTMQRLLPLPVLTFCNVPSPTVTNGTRDFAFTIPVGISSFKLFIQNGIWQNNSATRWSEHVGTLTIL